MNIIKPEYALKSGLVCSTFSGKTSSKSGSSIILLLIGIPGLSDNINRLTRPI